MVKFTIRHVGGMPEIHWEEEGFHDTWTMTDEDLKELYSKMREYYGD